MTSGNAWRVNANDPVYWAALAEEARIWSTNYGPNPQDHPLRVRYANEVITGDPEDDAIAWFARTYGPFDHGCSLGCGTGRIEKRLLALGGCAQLEAYDISAGAVASFTANSPGNVSAKVVDLNFIELPEDSFDLVIVWEALHHVINLEHVLFQIARALRPNGLLLIREFIGETRWQWTRTKLRTVNTVVREIRRLKAGAPVNTVGRWKDTLMSPFESIRSGEVMRLLHVTFGKALLFERQWEAVCHDALGAVDYRCTGSSLDFAIERLIDADRKGRRSGRHGLCPPNTLFAVCRKPEATVRPTTDPWNLRQLCHQLDTTQYLVPTKRLRLRAKYLAYRTRVGQAIWRRGAAWWHSSLRR